MTTPTFIRSRWLSPQHWTLDRFLTALTFLLIFTIAACMNFQSDTWWLLRAGQDIWASGHIPTIDPYSSTIRGMYWPNHEWLTEAVFYGLYALGGTVLLVGFCATVATLTWYGVYRMCDGPPRVRALAVLLGMVNNASGWSIRPQLLSWALFVLVLWLVPQHRRHWWYIPLFLIWANLHAGVGSGGMLLGAAALVALVSYRAQFRHWFVITLSSGVVTLINPLGWRLWEFVLDSVRSTTRQYIQEWQPPSLGDPSSYPFFILAALCVISLWRARHLWHGHRDWTMLVAAGLFLLLSARSVRHTMFFAVVAVPLLTRQFQALPRLSTALKPLGLLHLATLSLAALAGIGLIVATWSQRQPPLTPANIAAIRACPGTLFNTFEDGGPVMWFVPERPVFIDNRYDPYPNELFIQAAVAEDAGNYAELFSQYAVRCALVPVDKPIYPALQRDGWSELQRDGRLAVLRR